MYGEQNLRPSGRGVFNKGIEDLEAYPETGMRATVIGFSVERDDVGKVRVSYKKFDEYNKQFESSNYYDAQGKPVLTARESGNYNEGETLYTDVNPARAKKIPFKLLAPELDNIMEEWRTEQKGKSVGVPYAAWVTQKLVEARLENVLVQLDDKEGAATRQARVKP
jgi:hypothetical protein